MGFGRHYIQRAFKVYQANSIVSALSIPIKISNHSVFSILTEKLRTQLQSGGDYRNHPSLTNRG